RTCCRSACFRPERRPCRPGTTHPRGGSCAKGLACRHGFVLSHLRFDLKGLSLVLKVLSDGELRTVTGLLIGECEYARLRVRRPDGARKAHVEADGSFRVPGLPPGPLSLSVLRQGRVPVVTEWFTV